MKKLFTINNKDIYDINTSILYSSDYNTIIDAIDLLHNSCVVIDKNSIGSLEDIPSEILDYFNCQDLITKTDLTKIDKIKIDILSNIILDKEIFVFLNILTYVDSTFKEKVIFYLKEHQKRIINYTTEIEETLILDYLIVFYQKKVIMEGPTNEILKEEKILKKLGFNLPLIVELSSGLKYYGLVNKIYYQKESLVDDLWN